MEPPQVFDWKSFGSALGSGSQGCDTRVSEAVVFLLGSKGQHQESLLWMQASKKALKTKKNYTLIRSLVIKPAKKKQ